MASLLKCCCFVFCSFFLCVLYNAFSVLQSLPTTEVKVSTSDAETQQLLSKLFKGSPEGFARFGEGGYLLHSFLKWHVDHVKNMPVRPDDVWVVTYPRSGSKGFARFGAGGYLLPSVYEKYADDVKTMPVRPDDIWVVTYPRSGTTWTQELVWLLMNDHDYETASKIPLMSRYFFVKSTSMFREDLLNNVDDKQGEIPENLKNRRTLQQLSKAPSPRFVKTHLPLSLLPDNLLDTTKLVYVARDPRDVAVSFYHFYRLLKSYVGDLKTFWNLFVNDSVILTPFFAHLKEAWANRDHPNMLFIFYEELQQNLSASIERIAIFLGKEVTSEQIQKLCEHLDIKNFKNNASVNPPWFQRLANSGAEGFIRNGGSGGWREHFDEGMAAQAQRWLHAQLADTDLRFPDAPAPK